MDPIKSQFIVLIISEDETLVELLRSTVTSAGYGVTQEVADTLLPDVAIVDLDSMNATSLKLFEQLRATTSDCQIIVIAEQTQRLREAVAEGAFWYLTKPFLREILLHYVAKIAPLDSTVLITGESGMGKTMLARHIHRHSSCANGPFITWT